MDIGYARDIDEDMESAVQLTCVLQKTVLDEQSLEL